MVCCLDKVKTSYLIFMLHIFLHVLNRASVLWTKIPTNLTLAWSFAYHKHAHQRHLHFEYRSTLIRSPVKEYNFL